MSPFEILLWTAAAAALALSGLLVLSSRWHARWTTDGAHGVQKFHTDPTPRVAGLALWAALWLAVWMAPEDVQGLLAPMVWAATPAFAMGLLEDLTKRVGVRERFLATMASGGLACWLTGLSVSRLEVWGVDDLLQWWPLSVAFTALAMAGLANAVNIIDGFHGLSSGVVIICLAALATCALGAGDVALAQTLAVLMAVVVGFMLLNFPWGKIFLGDGGAYLLGFCLGWAAVLLPARNPEVSPWASLLVCAYPIIEVLFSMLRRFRRHLHPGHPDRLHMHSLIKTRWARKRWPGLSPNLRNAAVSPLVWAMAAVPAVLAVFLSAHTWALALAFLACFGAYTLCYRRWVFFAWFR